MLTGRQCLVTGASGFIGGHLCRSLAAAGASVTALGRGQVPGAALEGLVSRWVRCDLSVPGDVRRAAQEIGAQDHFFHAAGYVSESRDLADLRGRYFAETVAPLLLADRPDGDGHVVLFSSVAVYGLRGGEVAEDAPLEPQGLYGANKAVLEDAFGFFARLRSRGLAVLRIASVYGAGMPRRNAIPTFAAALAQGRRPVVSGPPRALRDYVAVSDVVAAALAAAEKKVSGVFNIASGQPVGLADLARVTARVLGSSLEPDVRCDAQAPDRLYAVERAREALGLRPLSPDKGLARMCAEEGLSCNC